MLTGLKWVLVVTIICGFMMFTIYKATIDNKKY